VQKIHPRIYKELSECLGVCRTGAW